MTGKIERSWMNGKKREVFISNTVKWPNGLTIDSKHDVLYWCDAYLDFIERINTDGTGREVRETDPGRIL
jgi:integrin beta 2